MQFKNDVSLEALIFTAAVICAEWDAQCKTYTDLNWNWTGGWISRHWNPFFELMFEFQNLNPDFPITSTYIVPSSIILHFLKNPLKIFLKYLINNLSIFGQQLLNRKPYLPTCLYLSNLVIWPSNMEQMKFEEDPAYQVCT